MFKTFLLAAFCFVPFAKEVRSQVPDRQLVWAKGLAYPMRCHMGACTWAWFISDEEIGKGFNNGSLRSVTYKIGHSKDYFYSEDGLRRINPSADVEWGEGEESKIAWDNEITYNAMIYCSTDKLTVIYDLDDIRPFEFPVVYGYETAAVSMYFRICHSAQYSDNANFLRQFGYPYEYPNTIIENKKHRSAKFKSILDLLE